MYNKNKPCDSGITNYFFIPDVIKKAYKNFGYNCIYYSNKQINEEMATAIKQIKLSIDKGVPVLAWGIGNVTMNNGKVINPMPEGSLIGGYDGDALLVNLYPGAERLAQGTVDDDGYTLISNGLKYSLGIFIVGEKTEQTPLIEIYQNAIGSIPNLLTHPEKNGYTFGKQAFETWADTLLDDNYFVNKTDDELSGICWDLHCSPYCCVATMDSYNFIKRAGELYPQIKYALELLPLYESLKYYKDKIWTTHGDFYPPMEKFRTHEFREQLAYILRDMGNVCENIVKAFKN
jgi:hypothetical protein